jgi:hypothetical protein
MAYENSAGLSVANQYGPRNTGGAAGTQRSTNSLQTLTIDLTGEMLNSSYAPPVYMPIGAKVVRATLEVNEVFVVSAAGTVAIGGTVPGTNGVVLTEAQLEAQGTKDVSAVAVGTWATASATGTTATQKIAKAITGTVGATSGKGRLIIEYVRLTTRT